MRTQSVYRILVLSLSLAAAALVAGCAVSDSHAGDPLMLAPDSNRSPVVVSITTNTGQIRGFDQIVVTSVVPPGSKESASDYYLKRVTPDMARDTALFIGSLPPAEYLFKSFTAFNANKVLRVGDEVLLGKFTVHPGKRIDLGRLLLTPVNSKVVVGRMPQLSSNRDLIERFSPQHAAMFSSEVEAGWNGPAKGAESFAAYALGRPVGGECPTERADGTVVAASRLGTVLMRSKEGRWNSLRGPGIETLMCVLPVDLPDTELLAVGEFSTLLRKPRGVNKLVPVNTGNLPPGNLMNIAGSAAYGWIVEHQAGKVFTLFHSPTLEAGNWTPIFKDDATNSIRFADHGLWMWSTSGGMGYAVPRGDIRLLDFATGKWTERTTPNKFPLHALTASPMGLSVFVMMGGYVLDYVSHDQGATWQGFKAPTHLKKVPATLTYDGTLLMVVGLTLKEELQMSKDGGTTWTVQSNYEADRPMMALRSGDLLSFDRGEYGYFSIQSSHDGGKNWKNEYSTFDTAAYEAQTKDVKKK